jgi:peptidoglycan/LPS O-acetylase OafA/YrhL
MDSRQSEYYLTSIDGLRAVAVLLVLLFHVDVEWMRGGFIGVDVFFVISGFLITGNIVRDIDAGRWSFAGFYARRIARLFPALFTVVLITVAASYAILIPEQLERIAKAALSSTFSVSNIFFFNESGYFDNSASSKPLLHTWSLSVEEQFYLVWPLFLFIALGRWTRKHLVTAIGILSVAALAIAVVANTTYPEMVFFLTPFRAYQFGLGAMLAISGFGTNVGAGFSQSALGLFCIVVLIALASLVSGDSDLVFIALLPALAAVGFIATARSKIALSLFARGPLVWIGKRSYSIYLTHWPIIVLWKIKYGTELSIIEKTAAIAIAIATGYVLHAAVEFRFRIGNRSTRGARRTSFALIGFLVLAVIGISAQFWTHKGYPERIPSELTASASNLWPRWQARQDLLRTGSCNVLIGKLGSQTIDDFDQDTCLSLKEPKLSYVVLGDSFASGALLAFREAYPEVNFGQLTIPGCRILPTENIENPVCAQLFDSVLRDPQILQNHTGVIIASNWTEPDFDHVAQLIEDFQSQQLDVVVVGQRIRFDSAVPAIVLSSLSKAQAEVTANARLLRQQPGLNERMEKRLAPLAKYVNIIDLQCRQHCDIFTQDGKLAYLDASHFSLEGISMIARRLRAAYPNLLQLESLSTNLDSPASGK